jgi:hypothetical protein
MLALVLRSLTICLVLVSAVVQLAVTCRADEDGLRKAVTLYASFDSSLQADFSRGAARLRTRSDDPQKKGETIFKDGYPAHAFRVSADGRVSGALEAIEVLPNRGRIFYPAASNLAYSKDGWDGAVSFWLQTNPDTMLRTRFCDPIQITHRGAHNGGLWIDFPDSKPRSMRLGAFRALADGEKAIKESDPQAPLVRIPKIGFQENEWHHIAFTWSHFDSGKPNSHASLYIDGELVGELTNRDIAMRWDMQQAGIYVAVSLIGKMDELAVFDRSLSASEVGQLHDKPALLQRVKQR